MDATQQLVVVVEDDIGMRDALHRWLRACGYRTRAYDSAEALLGEDGARGADCLLLDVRLPGVSGTELYARLDTPRPPAVFITAHDAPTVRAAVGQVGGSAVLPKPFVGRALTEAIAAAIRGDD